MVSLSNCEGFDEFLKAMAIISGEEVAPKKEQEKEEEQIVEGTLD